MKEETILRGLKMVVGLSKVYKRAKPVIPVIKYGGILLMVLLVARWLGYV